MTPAARAGVALAVFALGAAALSTLFPPVSTDEVVAAARSWEIVAGRGSHYTLYDGVFHPDVDALRDLSPDNVRVMHNLWVGPFLALGRRAAAARLSSVAAAALALAFLFLFLRRRGVASPAGAALLAAHPIFWLAAVLVRPEMPLLAAGAAALWLIDRWPADRERKSPALGLWMGLCVGLHPNALPLMAGVAVHWHLSEPAQRSPGRWAAWSVGVAAAALALIAAVDLDSFFKGLRLFGDTFYRVPLLEDPRPWRWLGRPWHILFAGDTFYLREGLRDGWVLALRFAWAALLAGAVLGVARGRRTPAVRSLAAAFAVWWVLAAALVSRREALYGAPALLFLAPLAVLGFSTLRPPARRAILLGLPALQIAFGAAAVRAYRPSYLSEREIASALHALVPEPNAKILGPNRLWFMAPDRVRDLGALVFSRWFTGGRDVLGACLERWRPDVVVLDPYVLKTFFGAEPPERVLSRATGATATRRGSIDTGRGGDGAWDVLALEWPPGKGAP